MTGYAQGKHHKAIELHSSKDARPKIIPMMFVIELESIGIESIATMATYASPTGTKIKRNKSEIAIATFTDPCFIDFIIFIIK